MAKAACEYSLALVWPIRVSVDTCRPRDTSGEPGETSEATVASLPVGRSVSRDDHLDRETLEHVDS